jgi:hypothetical protein
MPDKNQPVRNRRMSKVKFISSPTEIPAGQTFMQNDQNRHLGFLESAKVQVMVMVIIVVVFVSMVLHLL